MLQSEISLGPLGRSDLNSRLVCRAMNHPKASVVEAVVQIDMNCKLINIIYNVMAVCITDCHIRLTHFNSSASMASKPDRLEESET